MRLNNNTLPNERLTKMTEQLEQLKRENAMLHLKCNDERAAREAYDEDYGKLLETIRDLREQLEEQKRTVDSLERQIKAYKDAVQTMTFLINAK